ncbi:unnamed protein product [Mytilus coruscus]|uniref:Uncharacterized protein n=1 Tax=Mytilus coruscus TaxID=42192 RepID=A0A6J8EJC0_MYTCO|nr:unnamed protein product [Mytilus coruscus]
MVNAMIQELASNNDTNEAAAKVVESVNLKDSDSRDTESEADEGKYRQVEDTNFMNSLFDFLEFDNNSIKKVTRLGRCRKKKANSYSIDTQNGETSELKPRPIRVTLKDADVKQEMMKKLSKLKSLEHVKELDPLIKLSTTQDMSKSEREANKLSITQDMSKSEREANKLKLQEAKDVNDKDKLGKFKYIVGGPPSERRVVKVQRI